MAMFKSAKMGYHFFKHVHLLSISFLFFIGKCAVSSFKDFISCRPTEFAEVDVHLCESRYIESEKQMKKFKGLKRFSLSSKVVDDEIYYFRSVSLLFTFVRIF